MKLELFFPLKPFFITQRFGENPQLYASLGIAGHNGLDCVASHGQPVRAAHDGVVSFAGDDGKGGWGVVIRTNEPRDYQGSAAYFKTIYWHLVANIPVKAGQQVKCGDVIGYADSTGFSTGDHLHFGLKPLTQGENAIFDNLEQKNGYNGAIDPFPFLSTMSAEEYASFSNQLKLIAAKVAELLKQFRK